MRPPREAEIGSPPIDAAHQVGLVFSNPHKRQVLRVVFAYPKGLADTLSPLRPPCPPWRIGDRNSLIYAPIYRLTQDTSPLFRVIGILTAGELLSAAGGGGFRRVVHQARAALEQQQQQSCIPTRINNSKEVWGGEACGRCGGGKAYVVCRARPLLGTGSAFEVKLADELEYLEQRSDVTVHVPAEHARR